MKVRLFGLLLPSSRLSACWDFFPAMSGKKGATEVYWGRMDEHICVSSLSGKEREVRRVAIVEGSI
jgi:hypothetical protein